MQSLILKGIWKLGPLCLLIWFVFLGNISVSAHLLCVIRGIITLPCLPQTLGTDVHFQKVINAIAALWAT